MVATALGRRSTRWLVLLLPALVLALVLPARPAQAGELAASELALRATVRLSTPVASNGDSASCSGAVFRPSGYILTAFHCIGAVAGDEDSADAGLKPGEWYNPDGRVVVSRYTAADRPSARAFEARVLAGNADLDVAVLKITRRTDPSAEIPAPLPLAGPNAVRSGDPITVLGFPKGNGNHLIPADGTIRRIDQERGLLVYDAVTDHGHSGGPVLDAAGEIVGVHSARTGRSMQSLRVGTIVALALPYVEQAVALGGDAALADAGTVPVAAVGAPATTPVAAAVAAGAALLNVDSPVEGAALSGVVTIGGWAIDPAESTGTGIAEVQVYLDGQPDQGGTPLGRASYGASRQDVALAQGAARYDASGFNFSLDTRGIAPGAHTLYIVARSLSGGQTVVAVPIVIARG